MYQYSHTCAIINVSRKYFVYKKDSVDISSDVTLRKSQYVLRNISQMSKSSKQAKKRKAN